MLYLFKHDSTHGPHPLHFDCDNEYIVSGGKYKSCIFPVIYYKKN